MSELSPVTVVDVPVPEYALSPVVGFDGYPDVLYFIIVFVAPVPLFHVRSISDELVAVAVSPVGLAGRIVTVAGSSSVVPPLSVTVSVAVYVPGVVYVCDGFCAVDVSPSPKSQFHEYGVVPPLALPVKLTEFPTVSVWSGPAFAVSPGPLVSVVALFWS